MPESPEAKGSYVHETGVEIIDVLKHKNFFHPIAQKGKDPLAALGKTEGVFLLSTDSNFDYEIKFEYQNLERWKITKMEGGTGMPEGV